MSKEEIANFRKSFEESVQNIDNLIASIQEERNKLKESFEQRLEMLRFGQIDWEQLDDFFEEPYVIIPKRQNEWYVITPRWINFQIGWLERVTQSYNIFVVNQYVKMFSEIPESLSEKFQFKEGLPLKVYDGMLLTGKELQDTAWERYKSFLTMRQGEDRIRIKRGAEFKLIAEMIKNGTLPFLAQPVFETDLREFDGIQLRDYQEEAWREFLERGAMGIFWAYGAGKSFFGVYVLGRIKGKKLVVVPTITLKEQWRERINKYLPKHRYEIEIETYHSYEKLRDQEYNLIIYDECQHLPANTFIRLATLRTAYRLGFSGSPYREDGRENLIIALTGFPHGMSWERLLSLQVVRKPVFRVYLLSNEGEKMRKLKELLEIPVKTLVFCDWIDEGKKIAKTFDIPFIYSETKDRLDVIRKSQFSVISRVGDEGISLPDLERVIEYAGHGASRRQEGQRFGRVMHAQKKEPEHIILMTEKEFQDYGKRLNAILEHGFQIEYIR